MVNKAVVGVIGVVLITTLGVGALVGLQGGGSPVEDGSPNATDGNGNGGPAGNTPTPTPTATPGEPTETIAFPNITATPVPDRLALTRDEFTAAELEENVTRRINEWRTAEDLDTLDVGQGSIKERLRSMARAHSSRMATAETVAHEIGNDTTRSRYRAHGLHATCAFDVPEKQYLAQPGGASVQQFEWVAGTPVETSFSRDRGLLFHRNESTVAEAIVNQWRGDNATRYGLLSSNYGRLGVGVNVTSQGHVYATAHLCGK